MSIIKDKMAFVLSFMKDKHDKKRKGRSPTDRPFLYRKIVRLLSYILHLDQVFGNLNSVQGSAFLNLVAYSPECQTVRVADILADAVKL